MDSNVPGHKVWAEAILLQLVRAIPPFPLFHAVAMQLHGPTLNKNIN
jgi:hypothetical protein